MAALDSRTLASSSSASFTFFSQSFLAFRCSFFERPMYQASVRIDPGTSGSGSRSNSGNGPNSIVAGVGSCCASGSGSGTGSGLSRPFFFLSLVATPQALQLSSALVSSAGGDPKSPKSNPSAVVLVDFFLEAVPQGLLSLGSSFGAGSPMAPRPHLLAAGAPPVLQSLPHPPKLKPVPPVLGPGSKFRSSWGAPLSRLMS